jgi:Iron-containing redox enzyme
VLAPKARGTLGERLLRALRTADLPADLPAVLPDGPEDAALALWLLHEQHYRGFEDVPDDLEWHPVLLTLQASLESALIAGLRSRYVPPGETSVEPAAFAEAFFAYVESFDGPSLARHVQRRATREQVLDVLRARSVYQLKEADPTTWLIPRVSGVAQASLVALQYDEYGAGRADRAHAGLFARGMAACRLDPAYGAYVDDAPLEVLELNNALTLFGLHRRWRGAAAGFLAAFEATSSLPARRMSQGLRRLGMPEEMAAYYDEHVEADAVHEQLAVREICAPMVAAEPGLVDDVYFGAFACVDLEARLATGLLESWST